MQHTTPRSLAYCALFAALITVCTWIAIPIGPVPVSLGTFAVMLAGLLLGWKYGALAVAVYILLGLAGVPVFTNFRAASALVGPTGGYIVGYLPYAMLAGLPVPKLPRSFAGRCALLVCGTICCYAPGTAWFMHVTGRTLAESLGLCVLPFLPGDAAKIILSALLAPRLRKALKLRFFQAKAGKADTPADAREKT